LVNYTVETKIKLVGDSTGGLVIGFQSGIMMWDGTHHTYYLVRLDSSSIRIYQYAKGWRQRWSQARVISTDTWHDLKVEHLGSIIKVSLDGSEVGSWTQPWPTAWNWTYTSLLMNAEGVGLMNYSGEAYWDDVTIATRPAMSRATVLMPSLVTEPTTIHMYYGNPSATSQSDIQSTFLFGDDFDDEVFDTTRWGVWSITPGGEWTDEVRWVSEERGRQEMTSPITGRQYTYVHTVDTFTGPAAFGTRFEKGGYMYRGFYLVDSPIGAERTVEVYIRFQDSGRWGVYVWTRDGGNIDSRTFESNFSSRSYFGEYYMTIVRNGDGTFTFRIQTEDEHTKTWEYTTTATIPLDVPLQILMYDHPWRGCRGWGVWERYQDDVRVLSSLTDNSPPQADAGGPYEANEGDTLTLDASGSTDPDNNIDCYEWDLDDDGEYDDASGVTTEVVFDDNGAYTMGLRVTDESGLSDTDTAEVTVNNVPPVVIVDIDSQTVQYSDYIFDVTFTATDVAADITVATSLDPLPSSLTLTANGCSVSGGVKTCTWTLVGTMDQPVEDYDITVTVTDDDLGSGSATTIISVVHEDADIWVDSNNPVAVQVDSPGGDSPAFSLTAHVKETYPDEADCAPDPGDISNAQIQMTLAAVGPGSSYAVMCTPVEVTGTDYDAVLEVSCGFDNVEVNTYHVQATVVGDHYTRVPDEDVLVVFDPSLGFTTGGGWFYWPVTTERTNFGYVMKYNKKATKVQGCLLLIRHVAPGEKRRVKSNALYGLSLGESEDPALGWASFSGKCTYKDKDWDEPEGNHEFVVYVEDWNEPGAGHDQFWIELRDKDGNVIAVMSMDRDAPENTETLGGGNIVVPHTPN
jgi:hypothetical protein